MLIGSRLRGSALSVAFVLGIAGSPSVPPFQVVELSSPNEAANGLFGVSVADAGDVNRDGFSDLVVGALYEGFGRGRAYIFSGHDRRLLFDLRSPNGEVAGRFGNSVSGAGDVNRDGFADVIVGAYNEDPGTTPDNAGRAYLISGQDGGLLLELSSPNEEMGGQFGFSVSDAGDIDHDGFSDVIVGAPGEDPGISPDQAGRAYLISGRDGSLLFELASPNQEQTGHFGGAVAGAGDVNRDGHPDLIVGAELENPGGSPLNAGRAYVLSGLDGSLLFELVSPNEQHFGYFGQSVSGAGDVDSDGFADLIVGAGEDADRLFAAGRAYVFSGQDGKLLFELLSPHEETAGGFGGSVSGGGDVNGDGFADVIVGALWENPGGSPMDAGRAYIFSGPNGHLVAELISPNEAPRGYFGISVSGAARVDDDDFADVIVGAPGEDPGVRPPESVGRAYLFERR